jgi:UDP-glucose 4-epimerase
VAKRVFISGVAGFVGSHLADAFLAEGHAVVGIDNMIGGYPDNVPAGVDFHLVDCNDVPRVRAHMEGCDIVYHCAATAYEGLSFFSPHLVIENVVSATAGMLSAACAARVKRFVYCSSMARYGDNPAPFTEDMTPKPQDPYGIGKLAAERLVQNLCDAHGIEYSIAIPHNIIGPRQKYDDPYRNVASIFINLMLQGRQPYIYGDGTQKRCFSFVLDVIQPLVMLGVAPIAKGQIYNVGPEDEPVSINELAQMIAEHLRFDLRPTYVSGPPMQVKSASCSAAKARKDLGYTPRMKLRDGLAEMIAWIRARGPRPFRYHLGLEIEGRSPETWTKRLL